MVAALHLSATTSLIKCVTQMAEVGCYGWVDITDKPKMASGDRPVTQAVLEKILEIFGADNEDVN